MFKYVQILFVVGVIAAVFLMGNDDGVTADDIDLNAVLDVTVDSIYSYQDSLGEEQPESDAALVGFADHLADAYNTSSPALHTETIGVAAQTDASFLAFEDTNNNQEMEEAEDALYLIEVDGENSRIIATSRSGAISDHRFSGTGLLTGYLIGSMLSRQRAAGVNPKSLAGKKPVTARAAARARAGSGSHSRGK